LRLTLLSSSHGSRPHLHPFPTRRSSDLLGNRTVGQARPPDQGEDDADLQAFSGGDARSCHVADETLAAVALSRPSRSCRARPRRSEEHTSELQSRENLVCRLLLEKKKLQ